MKHSKVWQILLIPFVFSQCGKILDPDISGNLVPRTVAEDTNLPSVEVNGTKLHCETFGDIRNPIIVFLTGGPGIDYRCLISEFGVENASRYIDERKVTNGGLSRLADQYYCVFFDQRGAGLSPRFDKGTITFSMLLEDLDALINHYLEKKKAETSITDTSVILFGYSFGGVLATGYVNAFPDKVSDIITYEAGPFTQKALDKLQITSPFLLLGQKEMDEWLMALDHITPDDHARADYQQALGASRFVPEFHYNESQPYWRIGAFMYEDIDDFGVTIENNKLVNNLMSFKGRFVFICGELVANGMPGYGTLQTSYYLHGEQIEIPGTGHSGVWEKSSEVVNEIRTFLGRKK